MSPSRGFLRPDNQLTTCPPGKLVSGSVPLIIVASLRRTGTHLLIDAILNNFAVYKRRPLYVDLDRYLTGGFPISELLECGGYIVKTHFPQTLDLMYEEQVRAVAQQALILTPTRPSAQTYTSTLRFGTSLTQEEFAQKRTQFEEFWRQYQPLEVSFADLISPTNYDALVARIGEYISQPPNKKLVLPFSIDQYAQVYSVKTLTRLLGHHSPIVNTTISFAK